MNAKPEISSKLHDLGVATVKATAIATTASWLLLLLLSGSMIPRPLLVGAVLASVLAICAIRAARTGEVWVLLVATFFALTPPDIGAAPAQFRFIGFLAAGYGIGAMLLVASPKARRRVG